MAKDKVILQNGSNEDIAKVATSEMARSLEMKSSQGGNQEESLDDKKGKEPRRNTRNGFHEYPNPIQEKEKLV